MTTPTPSSSSPLLEKPSVDQREYRHLQLGGAMDVLLISDPDTDKASAACDIYVGQLCDTVPGIAHFCEHMLFIGTEKYPSENAYDGYLNAHGGSSNAFTDLEHTCYYFDVQAESLEGAFDRFSQCFIKPLFTQSALEREVQAVDSEHQKNLQQDAWRMFQLSKQVISGDPSHLYGSFGSGNQQSLPIETIRDTLLEFYQEFYRKSLSLYKLVVLGKESLDDLQAMVERYWNDLVQEFPTTPVETTTTSTLKEDEHQRLVHSLYPPMPQWQVPQRLHIVPVSQVHAVELQFPMRPLLDLYESKPTRYLSHLIGHEGAGSLLSLLKAKHYAQELYADDSSKSTVRWSIFTIRLELTELGLQNVDEVVLMIFSYLDLLLQQTTKTTTNNTGPPKWIHDELQTTSELQFRFLSQRNPIDYTCSLAGWMQHYPPPHYLSGPYKVYAWNPEAITECLQSLHPDNVLVLISSPTFSTLEEEEKSTTKQTTEQWYGTQYEQIPIDDALWNQWRQANHSDYPELTLPQVNDMIATEFDLLSDDTDTTTTTGTTTAVSKFPKEEPVCLLKNDPILRLWYKPDNVFQMPKVNILFHFASGDVLASPEAVVTTQLFVELVTEACNEYTYLASMAGLHCELGLSQTGLELHVTGYSHKAHVLVEKIIDTLLQPTSTNNNDNDEEVFGRIVSKLEQQYQSFLVGAQPYQHAIYGADLCLEEIQFTVSEKLAVLKRITLPEVLQFATRFWKHCTLEGLVHGNVTPEYATTLVDMIWNQKLGRSREEWNTHASLDRRVVQLQPATSYVYRFAEFNEANTNSVFQMVLQMGPTMELQDNATLAILHHLIKEPAFNQLRTNEQLGYIVHTSIKTSGDTIKGLLVLVQSDSHDPIHVEARVEAFLATMRQKILDLTQQEFQQNVEAVVASFLEKNKNLGEESSRYWHVILNQTYKFRRLQQISEHVKVMTKERVLRFFDKYVAASAPCRRKLCVQVFAKQHEEKMTTPVEDGNIVVIEDPAEFKRTMSLYPLPPKVDVTVREMESNTK